LQVEPLPGKAIIMEAAVKAFNGEAANHSELTGGQQHCYLSGRKALFVSTAPAHAPSAMDR
jgi:hypothetical protein